MDFDRLDKALPISVRLKTDYACTINFERWLDERGIERH